MIKPFFNILLALIVVSCPIRCQLGLTECCCADLVAQDSERASCCDSEGQCDSTKLPAKPAKPVKKCECKCICSGATMPDHLDLDFEIQCLPLFESNQLVVDQLRILLINDLRPPDQPGDGRFVGNSQNVGRLIRCLHRSLTI